MAVAAQMAKSKGDTAADFLLQIFTLPTKLLSPHEVGLSSVLYQGIELHFYSSFICAQHSSNMAA